MQTRSTMNVGAGQISIETGKLAKQADGAAVVQLGDTVILVTVVAAAPKEHLDFFPLTVEYREKAAAVGRFPGGYFKREGRPTEKEILTCRMIDRPCRPLFPEGFYNDTQIIATLLSADGENDPDMLAINGASAALSVSDIPWAGPIGAVRVARVAGQLIANPTNAQRKDSDLDLIYVGSDNDLVMIEGSAKEIPEVELNAAIDFAHLEVKKIVAGIRELQQKAGKAKRKVELKKIRSEVFAEAQALIGKDILTAILTEKKLERQAAVNVLKTKMVDALKLKFPDVTPFELSESLHRIENDAIRTSILNNKRPDGRGAKDLRKLTAEVGLLPRPHGTGLFGRGETMALVLTTLGSKSDEQEMDCLLYTSPSPRDGLLSRMPSSA